MLALFDVHSISLHEQADSLQRIFWLHISALIKTLSNWMLLAFGRNAIDPGGFGAEPPRRPASVCSFTKQAKPNQRLRYLRRAKTPFYHR